MAQNLLRQGICTQKYVQNLPSCPSTILCTATILSLVKVPQSLFTQSGASCGHYHRKGWQSIRLRITSSMSCVLQPKAPVCRMAQHLRHPHCPQPAHLRMRNMLHRLVCRRISMTTALRHKQGTRTTPHHGGTFQMNCMLPAPAPAACLFETPNYRDAGHAGHHINTKTRLQPRVSAHLSNFEHADCPSVLLVPPACKTPQLTMWQWRCAGHSPLTVQMLSFSVTCMLPAGASSCRVLTSESWTWCTGRAPQT